MMALSPLATLEAIKCPTNSGSAGVGYDARQRDPSRTRPDCALKVEI